jgi:hypothetical protein
VSRLAVIVNVPDAAEMPSIVSGVVVPLPAGGTTVSVLL